MGLGGGAAALAALLTFTLADFWWYDGYRLVMLRYYQGWVADRPYSY